MIAALDVYYDEPRSIGIGSAIIFHDWGDAAPAAEYVATVQPIEPYVPGQFYRRELPCLMAVLAKIKEPLSALVIDGYVCLDGRPGMGQHLYDSLAQRIPIIGVAKTRFHNAPAIEILRGRSRSPLYITAVGIDAREAADHLLHMHGQHRIPTLLHRADGLGRGGDRG